jgi:hypothetical protein
MVSASLDMGGRGIRADDLQTVWGKQGEFVGLGLKIDTQRGGADSRTKN